MVSLCTLLLPYPILAMQGRPQWWMVEFRSGKLLPLIWRCVWRKSLFKVPRSCVLCSILWGSPELMHLLQECPNGDLLKSPVPEIGTAWQVKEGGIAWDNPLGSLWRSCRHRGITSWGVWLLWRGRNPLPKENSYKVIWLLHLTREM